MGVRLDARVGGECWRGVWLARINSAGELGLVRWFGAG